MDAVDGIQSCHHHASHVSLGAECLARHIGSRHHHHTLLTLRLAPKCSSLGVLPGRLTRLLRPQRELHLRIEPLPFHRVTLFADQHGRAGPTVLDHLSVTHSKGNQEEN